MADQQIVAQMQARINELSAQTAELVQGLARANAAYESQRERLTSAEQELVDTKAKLQEQASSSSGSRETQLIHPSDLPKPPQYNDKKEEWEKFKHIFMAWTSTVHKDFPRLLDKAGREDKPLDMEVYRPEEERLSKAMYTFLIQYCPKPTMNVFGQGFTDENGFEIWRRLMKLSEPACRTKAWVWRRH